MAATVHMQYSCVVRFVGTTVDLIGSVDDLLMTISSSGRAGTLPSTRRSIEAGDRGPAPPILPRGLHQR